jgi:hypothetical protein
VSIGMNEADLRARLGKPSHDRRGLIGWLYTGDTDDGGEVNARLWVRVEGGKVVALDLWQSTAL